MTKNTRHKILQSFLAMEIMERVTKYSELSTKEYAISSVAVSELTSPAFEI